MKTMTVLLTGCAMGAILCGCRPQLAQVELGEKEASWDAYFKNNYSSYNPPRTAPPAIRDNRAPEALNDAAASSGVSAAAPVPMEYEPMNTPAVEVGEKAVAAPAEVPAPVAEAVPATGKKAAPAVAAGAVADKAAPAVAAAGAEYVVKPGDSLSRIAKQFYKDGRKYNVILKNNPQLKNSPNKLRPGMKLLIPQL